MIIFLKGTLITLDVFIDSMAQGTDALIVDVANPEEKLLPVIDRLDGDTVVITFNNTGTGYALWKQKGVKLYNILVDHPAYYLDSISEQYYMGYHALCVDRAHAAFLADVFSNVSAAFLFMPHGGIRPQNITTSKEIDVLYAGGFRSDDEINFIPLPFGNSEEFFDHIISYYSNNTYVEAQDAVNSYCKSAHEDYSKEQKAIMTNYVVRSVEMYFSAQRRKELIRALAQNGIHVNLCGTELWKEIADQYPDMITYEGMKTPLEVIEYIGRSKVLINDLPYFAEGAHERVFNGMLGKTVVLSNESHYLEERFKDRESILFWNGWDYEEAVRKVREVLQNDDLRTGIADRAYELSQHDTWEDRFETIISLSK